MRRRGFNSLLSLALMLLSSRYASAQVTPYLDFPLSKLQAAVPKLHGLRPDSNQERLPLILMKVGETTEGLLQRMPNLICREQVVQTQNAPAAISHEEALRGVHPREFNYLILAHQGENNSKTLDEYRTDPRNAQIELAEQSAGSPRTHGFAYAWLLFFPSNQSQSRFRYLGRQKIDNHWTLVLAFAQNSGSVKSPGQVEFEGKWIPVFYQGVAWIEETTFRIVRLRTDLLASLPSVHLQRLTAELRFGAIHISQVGSVLWLPREVDTTVELNQQISSEAHLYSDYRLYAVRTRILPTLH